MRHHFNSRHSNRSGRLYSLKQIQTPIKPHFYHLLLVINRVHACVRTSAEHEDFQREGGGMCVPDDFISEVFCSGLSDIKLFRVSQGLLGTTF